MCSPAGRSRIDPDRRPVVAPGACLGHAVVLTQDPTDRGAFTVSMKRKPVNGSAGAHRRQTVGVSAGGV